MIDWAYADYHYCDYTGFRFGKFKTLQGLRNHHTPYSLGFPGFP